MFSQSMPPRSLTAEASILIAAASTTMPAAVLIAPLPNFAVRRNTSISASSTPTPSSPCFISSHFMPPSSAQTEDRILTAPANKIRLPAPLIICPLPVDIALDDATTIADNPAIATSPLETPSQSRLPSVTIAPARIPIAMDMASMAAQERVMPFCITSILLNTAMDAIRSANSTVIAPREAASLSLSIKESATSEAARIPTAVAIFISVPALMSCCHASKQPLTLSRMPTIDSLMLAPVSTRSFALFRNFVMPTAMALREMPLSRSMIPLKLALLSLSMMLPAAEPNALTIPPPIVFSALPIASII